MIKTYILQNDQVVEGQVQDLRGQHTTVWTDLAQPEQEELKIVAAHLGVSEQEIQELLHPTQRPILQNIGQFTAIVFHSLEIQKNIIALKPHLLLTSKEQKDFISIHKSPESAIHKILNYPTARKVELFRKGSTALLFAGLEEMTASGFQVLDHISEETSKLESQVFQPQLSSQVMKRIFNLKKGLIYFQRSLSSDREVISQIEKAYGQFLDEAQLANFRLLYSDLTQLIELSATLLSRLWKSTFPPFPTISTWS
ncbi:MAG: magnesium transporter CorA family protein [Candidatus Doudnabacteria bacterium]|nr:magnesium transporter CorA family protein [Candidatus Doudnabacteria bacterium]